MRFHHSLGFFSFLLLSCAHSIFAATLTFTGTPVGSWAFSQLPAPQIGDSSTYYPTSQSEYTGSQFQGYVADSPWGQLLERDEFQIFTTYVTSTTGQQVPLLLEGDDGHSLFVNGAFVGGGGFGVTVPYMLNLEAGVPVELEIGGYNGPGDWTFNLNQPDGTTLSQTPDVTLDAPSEVPEPSSIVVLAGTVGWLLRSSRRTVKDQTNYDSGNGEGFQSGRLSSQPFRTSANGRIARFQRLAFPASPVLFAIIPVRLGSPSRPNEDAV